ncbi:MAG: UDP-N-acetylglucosamine 2-epimerase (non-hydrolyzing), partial [Erysipelotrichia bacterium]|nr:UDP-N-acetylglucosamine 2-epimerase (non-hydrolyzing) [Erysipelotrichia bacterium]
VSAHREENVDIEENFVELVNSINEIAKKYEVPVIYSTHPRTRKFIDKRKIVFHPLVQNIKPLGFLDYVKLQANALLVVSDSGTLTEESAILGFPGVLIRTSTERPEGLDAGTIVVGGIKSRDVLAASELSIKISSERPITILPVDYLSTDVSTKVVKVIQSYVHIVNKTTWHK